MISPATIAAVRDRTDIVRIIGETVKLKRAGRAFVGLCPFHREKTPSFSVNQERGYFHCFGCKGHGSVIDFVMKSEGLSFPETIRSLAERAGVEIEDNATEAERREAAAARRAKDDLYAVNGLAATYFEHCLRGGPGARIHPLAHRAIAELARRGLAVDHPTIASFRIGYAPYAWDGLTSYLQKQGISPATAERVGLLVPRSQGSGHYDRFRHRLMFPVLDVMGRTIAFSGRALPEPSEEELRPLGMKSWAKPEEKPAKYINSPESPIYTKGEHLFGLYQARQAIRQASEAVLVEGNFDVVSLAARGIQNVVAPLGTAFTEAQARLLRRFASSVTLFLDGDTAGKKATWAARVPCRAAGIAARSAIVPAGMDPDDLAQRGSAGVTDRVQASPPLIQRLLDMALRDGEVDGVRVDDTAARVRAALQLVAECADDIERGLAKSYADQLCAAMAVGGRLPESTRALEAMLRRPSKETASEESVAPPLGTDAAMLGAVLDFPEIVRDHPDLPIEGDAALVVALLRSTCDSAEIVNRCPASLRDFVARRLSCPGFETIDEATACLAQHAAKRRQRQRRAAAVARLEDL